MTLTLVLGMLALLGRIWPLLLVSFAAGFAHRIREHLRNPERPPARDDKPPF